MPSEEKVPVRGHDDKWCYTCGCILGTDIERLIGVHIKCVHVESLRASTKPNLKAPSYSNWKHGGPRR
jgi:hypothetical protein